MTITPRLSASLLVGIAIGLAAPAWGEEPAADRLGDARFCPAVAPTYPQRTASRPKIIDATFPGGAKLHSLVAAPCLGAVPAFDV